MACDFPELPKGYEYNFIYENREVRIKEVSTAEKVQEWITQLQELTGVIWKVETTFPRSGRVNIYRKHFRCHHNTRRKTDSRYRSKNTNCPAKMRIVVKRDYSDCPKSQLAKADPDAKEWPCIVEFKADHNHSLTSEEALRYHPLAPNARKRIVDLYRKGHTPSSAYKAFCSQVMSQLGADYASVIADRAVIPTKIDFQNIWVNDFKKRYGVNPKIKTKKRKDDDSANEDTASKEKIDPLNPLADANCQLELNHLPHLNLQPNHQICSLQVNSQLNPLHLHPDDNFKTTSKDVHEGTLHHPNNYNHLTQLVTNQNDNIQNGQVLNCNEHFKSISKPISTESNDVMHLASNYHQIPHQTSIPGTENVQSHSPRPTCNSESQNVLVTSHCNETDQSILCKLLQQKECCIGQPRGNYNSYVDDLEVLDYNIVIDNSCSKNSVHPTLSPMCVREQNSAHLNMTASTMGQTCVTASIVQPCVTRPIRHQITSQSTQSGIIILPQSISDPILQVSRQSMPDTQHGETTMCHSDQTCSLDVDGVLKEFDDMCSKIKDSVKSDPINVIPAMRKLMNNFNTYINSQSELLCGLQLAFKPKKKRFVYRPGEQ